jgi:RecB family endonuclease NucS
MREEDNWVPVQSAFDRERWLSDHIAASPHELEAGMRPYPWASVREQAFDDRTRSDVLLLDRDGTPVVVECKQNAPTVDNVHQLRGYMAKVEKLVRDRGGTHRVRGILVHGGPRKVHEDVHREAERDPAVELVRYIANVDFARSN